MRRTRRTSGAEDFGKRVRELRHQQQLTQEGLGDKAGLHFTYIGSVERGERNVTLETILRLAMALGVDPGDLVTRLRS